MPMIERTFFVKATLTHSAQMGHSVDFGTWVTIQSPDEDHPIEDREQAAANVHALVSQFLNNSTHLAVGPEDAIETRVART